MNKFSESAGLERFFADESWTIAHTLQLPAVPPEFCSVDDLPLSTVTKTYLQRSFPDGVYRHQRLGLEAACAGQNVCLVTGTASGKSAVFYAAAIEELLRNPQARVLLVYPLKALGREQEDRLNNALRQTGLTEIAGRIDGQVPVTSRLRIIGQSRLVIMTPDIIHAWLLSSLSESPVRTFLRNLSLMVIDEVHNYSGVFGSNAAFLFRRLQHLVLELGGRTRFICASATIANPAEHVRKLTGQTFCIVGPEADSSPRQPVRILLMRPPDTCDLLTSLTALFRSLSQCDEHRFIAFVDSRKQVEYLSAIMRRSADSENDESNEIAGANHLEHMQVLPFRAGYEVADRDKIQDRLSEGTVRGVICTSALELGIDIPHLDVAVLVGVPVSRTSLFQRIGRIGRHRPGTVLVINRGDIQDEQAFKDPENFLNKPLAESSLYLENRRIQYLHALCLARQMGEHDEIAGNRSHREGEFSSPCPWPEGFLDLCRKERIGEIPTDLQAMKMEGGEDPNHTFPLRDVESQFQVELKQGPTVRSLGSLSHAQVLREAYPGAVYYYTGRPYRVYRIWHIEKKIQVRPEPYYTTKPIMPPTVVFPNLSAGNVHSAQKNGSLMATECNLQIREVIVGFKERRGSNEKSCTYPLSLADTGISFDLPRFSRNYFTTGIILTHPSLSLPGVDVSAIGQLVYESFLSLVPFERQDVGFAHDRHRADRGDIREGQVFLALHDKTYGSLRLSSRVLDDGMMARVLSGAVQLAEGTGMADANPPTFNAIKSMALDAAEGSEALVLDQTTASNEGRTQLIEVLQPGSKGLNIRRNNEEFAIEKVFFSPQIGGVAYRGRHIGNTDAAVVETVQVGFIIGVPGESSNAFYDSNSGELVSS